MRFKAFRISLGEIASGHSLFDLLWQNCRQLCRTEHSNFGSDGDLATLTRCDATAFAETGGPESWGGRWTAPSRRYRAQLFRLEWVKFIWAVDSSHLARLAASNDSIKWSAMSESPESSYSSSKALYLRYTYDAKNSLYNVVWNFLRPPVTQHTTLFLTVNLKRSFDFKPNQMPPLGIRLQPELQALGFKKKDLLHCSVPTKPPWLLKWPPIDFSIHTSCKDFTSPKIFRAKYYEICDLYQDFCKLCTDVSVIGDQLGSAAVCCTTTKTARLPNIVSIFRAELCYHYST